MRGSTIEIQTIEPILMKFGTVENYDTRRVFMFDCKKNPALGWPTETGKTLLGHVS
jgi:hypothetical protein